MKDCGDAGHPLLCNCYPSEVSDPEVVEETGEFTVEDFYVLAGAYWRRYPEQRYGQALFNFLLTVREDLAERIRGTATDPFYVNGNMDKVFERFDTFLRNEWDS